MTTKKSECYFSFWQSCVELRGSMDASQYKIFVVVMQFAKYVTLEVCPKKMRDLKKWMMHELLTHSICLV
ncbi:hypothetical protein [Polaromonas glacialis]|jgi:type I restriction enzyme M protein|uniref:hypothetical protein n=1 Tax=Polaromonas glacialis TaxID=866564 RepID=UPI0012EC3B8B|nr:hypothetical protein [Polaromonas glacialis]